MEFSEEERLMIADIARKTLPEEQKKCGAYRFFEDERKVNKLYDGFAKIEQLIIRLDKHEASHEKIEIEMQKIKKGRWIHKVYTIFGAMIGGFIAILVEKKLKE